MTQGASRPPDATTLAARRAWLFPRPRRRWQGIDLGPLDPSDPGDRAVLIRADHPGTGEDVDELAGPEPAEGTTGTRLHLAIHEVVSNQLWDGDPPEVGEAADRLRSLGYERHDVVHMLGSVVARELWTATGERHALDPSERQRLLDELPGSWEQLRADEGRQGFHAPDHAPDHDADGADDDCADDEFDDFDGADVYEEDDVYDGDDDLLLGQAHRVLGERGPLELADLAEAMDVPLGVVEELVEDPAFVFVDGTRLASVPAALEGVTLTHRLSSPEAGQRMLEAGPGLSPLAALVCGEVHLHLPAGRTVDALAPGEQEIRLSLDGLGLPGLGEGAALGFRIFADDEGLPTVEPLVLDEVPPVTDTLCARLRSSFERLDDREGMPAPSVALLCQLLLDAPGLASQPLPPLEVLLERAGFEVRDGFAAPGGTDWSTFERVRSLAGVCARRGLDVEEARALVALVQAADLFGTAGDRDARVGKGAGAALAHLLGDPEVAEAFAEAVHDDAGTARPFLRHLRLRGGRRHEAGVWWCESLVAGRAGDVEAAQACIRAAVASDPEHVPALCDAAWYASDRGDAAEAGQLLERADDEDEGRLALLRGLSTRSRPAAPTGRNDPCPCGSGRKYKQCCLARPSRLPSLPLDERVRWLWEKLRWWLERFGPYDDLLAAMFELHGAPQGRRATEVAVDLDVAASLVLFCDGAVGEFIHQRGPLLPVDEANLVAQWSLGGPSVHEIGQVRVGEGFSLRDLRSGDVVDVRERSGSRLLRDGDLVFAHPVFDGTGYQIVGGIVPVTLGQRGPLMDLLDEGASSIRVAAELARTRRLPELFDMEGEPMVLCRATYHVAGSPAAAERLDEILERQGPGTWAETVEVGGQRLVRAQVLVEGERLTLSANSEARFDRIVSAVAGVLGGLELLGESREPAATAIRRQRAEEGQPSGGPSRPSPPGVASAVEQFVRQREVAWLDEEVPALGGLTPRQAADDPSRREDLVALLHEYERATVPEGAFSYDVDRLRQLLGMGGS